MKPCTSCAAASVEPLTGLFHAGCHPCLARMLAQSPAFRDAQKSGRISVVYRELLATCFGDVAEGHRLVKEWAERVTLP